MYKVQHFPPTYSGLEVKICITHKCLNIPLKTDFPSFSPNTEVRITGCIRKCVQLFGRATSFLPSFVPSEEKR